MHDSIDFSRMEVKLIKYLFIIKSINTKNANNFYLN